MAPSEILSSLEAKYLVLPKKLPLRIKRSPPAAEGATVELCFCP